RLRQPQLCRIELRGHVRLLVDVDPIRFPLVAAGTDGERRKRGAPRAKQQFSTQDFEDRDPHSRGTTEEGAMTFDTTLDHWGIGCSECQTSPSRCQGVHAPLRGHWPWPYDYRGCQVVCRIITPCWGLARI
ncbi:hypothetical protein D4764_01G0006940, partial [Takifugu flavidus]